VTATRFNLLLGTLLLLTLSLALSAVVPAQTKRRVPAKRSTPAPPKLTAQATADYNEAVKQGDALREAGRLNEAVGYYVKALRLRPDWAEGWWHVGTILYDSDQYADARDALRNLVALDPKKGPAWALLGLCEFQTREYERALASLQRGRTLGLAGNRELENVVRYHGALLYIRLEQFEVAFEVLREFMMSGNESPKVIEAYGLTMLRLPFLPSEIPPDKREQVLIAGRAGFNMAARRKEEARQAFDELLARYSDTPNVHYAYGVFLMGQDTDAALKEFQRELELSPNHVPSLLQMAFEYLKRGEFDTALPLAEKSVQFAPKMYPARNVLGRLLLELGQPERAVKELEEGVRLAPESPEMHYALARAYTRVGRKQEATKEREIFQRLEKLYNAQRTGVPTEDGADNNLPKAKP
jgi:tetratricopeptide (TPR) repeat protein